MTPTHIEQAAARRFGDRNLIPGVATALLVEVATLTAYFGQELVQHFEPYRAVLVLET